MIIFCDILRNKPGTDPRRTFETPKRLSLIGNMKNANFDETYQIFPVEKSSKVPINPQGTLWDQKKTFS